MIVTYEVALTVTRAVDPYDVDDSKEDTAAWMTTRDASRELEHELYQLLRRLDGDCDIEVSRAFVGTE